MAKRPAAISKQVIKLLGKAIDKTKLEIRDKNEAMNRLARLRPDS